MRIYLDSKDIIKLLEQSIPLTAKEFGNILRKGKHELVFSFVTIMEISEPLLHKKASTNVMWLLNQIEKLPHNFIHSSRITPLELEKAFSAFLFNKEYSDINPPFVDRFDTVVDLEGEPATKQYFNYPLAEIIWDLYNFGALGGLDKFAEKLRKTFEADRAIKPRPKLKDNFTKTVALDIKQNNLNIPLEEIKLFADWVYSNPIRCPSARLGYELWHKIVRNNTDVPKDSDLEDFHNIECLPYVDIMTVDRRMHGYVCQVASSIKVEYDKKIFKSAKDFIKII